MVHYLISAHGRMAGGIKESLNVLLGTSDCVEVFDAYVDEANVEEELKKRIEAIPQSEYLVMMSDISGGSVNQIMMHYLDRKQTFLVTGISLALVIGLTAVPREAISEEEIEALVEQSRDMMFLVKDLETTDEEEAFF